MTASIDDVGVRKRVPIVSRLSWLEALMISGLTGGLFVFGMALYIAWWVRDRRKIGIAFYIYLFVTSLLTIDFLPFKAIHESAALEWLATSATAAWLANAFVLRYELRRYYGSPEGGELEISPLLTALFSVFYLNYCLWVVRDSA